MLPRALLLVLAATLALRAGEWKNYGKNLTVKEETKISEILAHPDKYQGKKVKVRGVVTNVCPERGCYLNLKGDKKFQQLQFKVDDGVIVFPADAVGREAVAEGVVAVTTFSVAEQKEMCPIEAKALDPKFDPKKIKGPMKVVRLDGLGAELKN
ncbi:MAG: DUF4920 domain-containing protein [Acidobacteria bacterium]|nr:DUF4920 domain-containing protein [Acidobacteriota bacterium]